MLSTPIGLAVALAVGSVNNLPFTPTAKATFSSTAAATSYATTGAFTPDANSLLVAIVAVTACVETNATMSGGGLTWTKQGHILWGGTSQHIMYLFTAPVGGSPASTTPTLSTLADAGTAAVGRVWQVANYSSFGTMASAAGDNVTSESPYCTLSAADSSQLVFMTNAGLLATPSGITAPTGFSAIDEVYQLTPTCNFGSCYMDTGNSSVNLQFGGTTAVNWACIGFTINPAPA